MNNILVQNYKISYGELLLGVIGNKFVWVIGVIVKHERQLTTGSVDILMRKLLVESI